MSALWNAFKVFAVGLFANSLDDLVAALAKFLYENGKKIGFFLIYVGIILAVTAFYFGLANNLVKGLHQTIPSIVLDVWGWVMPANAVPCFVAVMTARLIKYVYISNKNMINKKINIMTSSGS